MAFNADFVAEMMVDQDFEIVLLEANPETNDLVMTVVHDIHPEIETKVSLVTKNEDGEDVMNLQFDGPDEYTKEEATKVLQEVMDALVIMIEKALVADVEDVPDVPKDQSDPSFENIEEGN